jgi:hypothetical protein
MFKLNPNPTFKATVKVSVPGSDPLPIEFEFKHRTRTGLAEWMKNQPVRSDREIVPEFIVGWSGVINAAGEQEPWSVDSFITLTENYPAASLEVYYGYIKALTESRSKN